MRITHEIGQWIGLQRIDDIGHAMGQGAFFAPQADNRGVFTLARSVK